MSIENGCDHLGLDIRCKAREPDQENSGMKATMTEHELSEILIRSQKGRHPTPGSS
jgi:hypothetical protein